MRRFRCPVVAAVAVIGFVSVASAADMPVKAPVRAAPIAPVSWTGCYLGLSAGVLFGHSSGYSTTAASLTPISPTTLGNVPNPGMSDSFDLNNALGGAFAGCNYQAGAFVIGAEGDWSVTNIEGRAFNIAGTPFNTTPAGFEVFSLKEHWLGTARLRLGYAWGNTLVYVTGGGAWAKLDSSQWQVFSPSTTTALQTDWRGGWTVGGGLEYMVGNGWTIRGEYLYVDLGRYTTFTNIQPPFVNANGPVTNLSVNLHDNIFRFGIAYKFGWVPAVVANN